MTNTSMIKNQNKNLKDFSDSELYQLCQKYGRQSRRWSREFGFLLPEVLRRRLHRRRKCQGIHQFASTIGGMSNGVVDRILNLHAKLHDKPLVWNTFRRFGWSKLRVIASVVTIENQNFWIEKLEKYPKPVLEEYVKEWKQVRAKRELLMLKKVLCKVSVPLEKERVENKVFNKPKNKDCKNLGDKNLFDHESQISTNPVTFHIDGETEFRLRKLQQKQKETITLGETLKILLDKVEKLEKEVKKQKGRKNESTEAYGLKIISLTTFMNKKTTRHISAQKQQQLDQKYNGKCTIPGCNNPSCENHHVDRYSEYGNHNRITPVCKTHHKMIHLGLIDEEALWKGKKDVVRIEKEGDKRDERPKAIDNKVAAYLSG